MEVFYVTGMVHGLQARQQFGKFFKREDAEAHLKRLEYPRRTELRVEQKTESLEDQHFAHGGNVGR